MPIQRSRPLRLAALVFASAVFFVTLGPTVGAIIFIPDVGPLAASMVAHAAGFFPALLTGILNAMVIMARKVDSRFIRGRLLHAFVGGLCGFISTIIFLDYPDWVLIQQTSGWYDFWYTFNRAYVEFSMAGLVAGAICSFTFNPWAQRRYVS